MAPLLNVARELLEGKYKNKLNGHYESPQHSVVAQVFRGLSGRKVITPSKDFVRYVDILLFIELFMNGP